MKKMRKYKWILFMVLILCLTLTVLGGSRSKDDQYIHVGIAVYDLDDTFMNSMITALEKRIDEAHMKKKISYEICDAKGNSRRVQSDQVAYGEIFAYPDGLYNQLTIFVDTLTKFEEKQKTSSSTNGASNTTDNTARDSSKQNTSVPQEYQNALTKGLSYARNLHMSKKGVYDQLTSSYGEGFAADAAQYAIDNMTGVDWNANALEKAKQYYYNMSMSKSAVYDQLTSEYGEQFTASQAQYAIDHLD